jgi:hypothetical protein
MAVIVTVIDSAVRLCSVVRGIREHVSKRVAEDGSEAVVGERQRREAGVVEQLLRQDCEHVLRHVHVLRGRMSRHEVAADIRDRQTYFGDE